MKPVDRMAGLWEERDDLGRPGLRWSIGFIVVASVFAGAAWLAIHWTPKIAPPPAPPPAAVMIDLAPLPAAPVTPPSEAPPGPQQTLSQPQPPEPEVPQRLPEAPPSTSPEIAAPVPPKPKPVKHRKPVLHHLPLKQIPDKASPAPETTAPPQLQAPPASAAAPSTSSAAPAPPSDVAPTWQGLLLGRLEQFKRYPIEAQEERQEGTAMLTFSMDRKGHVLSAHLASSSGHALLDQETLALIHRADPLPPPPDAVKGDPITLTVPVQFFVK